MGLSVRICLTLIGAGDPNLTVGGVFPGLGFRVYVKKENVS